MKKGIVYLAAGAILLSGCDTYTGAGAYAGATLGSIIGSAIGGISNGPRGSDLGTIVGMAGGAAVGAVIGSVGDKADQQRVHDHYDQVQRNKQRGYNPYDAGSQRQTPSGNLAGNGNDDIYSYSGSNTGAPDESGFDATNSGDDRITFSPSDTTNLVPSAPASGNPGYSASEPTTVVPNGTSNFQIIPQGVTYTPNIEIANARFVDANEDGTLSRNEDAKVTFEIYNRGQQTLFNVVPSVVETTGNRHISITPSIIVESLAPGHGIVYTAFVRADKRLADGNAKFALAVLQGKKSISKVTEFDIPTRK